MSALKKTLVPALILAVIAGLWISLHYTFSIGGPDSDSSVPVMLWHGWNEHGIKFFSSWFYTQDNWLLSLIPIAFLDYSIFGVNGYSIVGLGWVIFVINAALLAVLMRLLSGKWTISALVIIVLGLFASRSGIENGQLAYSISKNVSMLWVLLALMVFNAGINNKKLWALLLGCVIFIGGVSDPWFNAVCSLPLLIVLSWIILRDSSTRPLLIWPLSAIAAGWLLAATKGLGLMSFLQKIHLMPIASLFQVPGNMMWYIATLANIFQIFNVWAINHLLGMAYLITGLFFVLDSIYWLTRHKKTLSIRQKITLNFLMVSCFIISVSFFLTTFARNPGSGHYLINIYYGMMLFVVFIYALRWQSLPVWLRFTAAAWVLVFIIAGAASDPPSWKGKIKINDFGTQALANFLDKNGLHYGYGDYFGTQTNTVNWTSNYRVLIRPITLQRLNKSISFIPRFSECSFLWFEANASNQKPREFLILNRNKPLEFYPGISVPALYSIAISQFGKPAQLIEYGDYLILVWNHRLISHTPGEPRNIFHISLKAGK